MSFEQEQENLLRKSREAAAERARESRESKEGGEMDEAARAAAAMERADYLVKEVKGGKRQIQNIVIHMQSVLQAIQALKKQLDIEDNGEASSVEQDKRHIEKLKSKIAEHKDELIKMKDELIKAQVEQIREGDGGTMTDDELRKKAEALVERIMGEIEEK